jgi:hypothetical protein
LQASCQLFIDLAARLGLSVDAYNKQVLSLSAVLHCCSQFVFELYATDQDCTPCKPFTRYVSSVTAAAKGFTVLACGTTTAARCPGLLLLSGDLVTRTSCTDPRCCLPIANDLRLTALSSQPGLLLVKGCTVSIMGLNFDLLEQLTFYGSYHTNKWNQVSTWHLLVLCAI